MFSFADCRCMWFTVSTISQTPARAVYSVNHQSDTYTCGSQCQPSCTCTMPLRISFHKGLSNCMASMCSKYPVSSFLLLIFSNSTTQEINVRMHEEQLSANETLHNRSSHTRHHNTTHSYRQMALLTELLFAE